MDSAGQAAEAAPDGQLVRALSHRQIQLIAIGGAIGVGLFLGAGKAIGDAGPAVLLCYAGAGAIVFLMAAGARRDGGRAADLWFALIKIVAIVAFIVSGLAIVVFSVGSLDQASVSNLWSHGGFFPEGLGGMLTALQLVTYAYLGIEMIGVTAGEARDPRRELPTAINRSIWRISLFYVVAIAVILMLIPWNQVSLETSPFVVAWESLGIGAAAGILNGVVLTSALSSCNSGIFASARMLHSLAGHGEAPRPLESLNRNRVPDRALLVRGGALGIGVLINFSPPARPSSTSPASPPSRSSRSGR